MLPPLAESLLTNAKDGFLAALGAGSLAVLLRVNRLIGIFKDYPPHIHENGSIRFPKGYEPGKTQRLFPKSSE